MTAKQLEKDSVLKNTILQRIVQRIEEAGEEELRPLWDSGHGLCTSWAVLHSVFNILNIIFQYRQQNLQLR
ncbi:hypothetical protein V8E54_000046 [Elaphomyces granulatus]